MAHAGQEQGEALVPDLQWYSCTAPSSNPGERGAAADVRAWGTGDRHASGPQCGEEGRDPREQAARGLRGGPGQLGHIRSVGQGELPEGAPEIPEGLGAHRKGSSRGRGSTAALSGSCPAYCQWTDTGAPRGCPGPTRCAGGSPLRDLGRRGRQRPRWCFSASSTRPSTEYTDRCPHECSHDTSAGGPAQPGASHRRPLLWDGWTYSGLASPDRGSGCRTSFWSAAWVEPGLWTTPQAPGTARQVTAASADDGCAAPSRHQRGHQRQSCAYYGARLLGGQAAGEAREHAQCAPSIWGGPQDACSAYGPRGVLVATMAGARIHDGRGRRPRFGGHRPGPTDRAGVTRAGASHAMDGPEPTGTCRLEGQTCQTSLGSFGYVVSCGQGCVCGAPDRNHRWRAKSLKAYRLLYSFDLCTGLSSHSGATRVASSRPAIVILGSLRSSLGFGGVVGLPSPFVASCRAFCSQLIAFLASVSPAPGFFCVDAGLPTSSPLGVLFRFSPIPSGVGFSSSAWHGEAPNSCIGGAGATAPRQDGFILHSRLFLSGAPACHGDGFIPVSTALLKAEHYHEYLRGVSVVQGLSPWLLPVTAVSVMGDLSHASAVRTLGDQPVPIESVCLSWPVPLPVVCVREYLRGVSVVQGLPPRTALPVEQPTVFSILEAFWLSLLRLLAACLVPLARSFLALLFLALLRVLAVPWRLTTPFGRACCFPLSGANTALLQPLGQVARAGCVLTWTPWRDRKGRLRPKCGHARPTSCLALWLWLALLSGLTLPCWVGPGPFSGIGAAWVLTTSLPLVHGAEAPEDLPAPSADEFDSAAAPDEPAPPEPRRLPDTIADGRVVRANDYISG